jgi:SPP1 gp7 family putative phage head morphogenesis protein
MNRIPLRELVLSVQPRTREIRVSPVDYSSSIESSLRSIYMTVVRDWWSFCRDILAPAYETPPPFVSDSDGIQLQWLIEQRDAWINSRIVYQTDTLRRWVTRLGTWHGGAWARQVRRATGVRVDAFITMEELRVPLEERIAQNVSLIRGLNSETRRRVETVVFDSFALRRTRREFLRELAKAMGVSQVRARLTARDQMEKIQAFLNQYRQEQLGFDSYIWRTSMDDRVRRMHREREGVVFRWEKPPSDGHPGHPVNCRCRPEAYMRIQP